MPEWFAGDPIRSMRFQRGAKSIAALNHPNIVTIFSVEEANGIHFLTRNSSRRSASRHDLFAGSSRR